MKDRSLRKTGRHDTVAELNFAVQELVKALKPFTKAHYQITDQQLELCRMHPARCVFTASELLAAREAYKRFEHLA